MNEPVLDAEPFAEVTTIGPVVAAAETTAEI
jgi:hypothetical protein